MYVCVQHGWPVPKEARRSQISRTGVEEGCEFSCECQKLNPGPLQEKPVPYR